MSSARESVLRAQVVHLHRQTKALAEHVCIIADLIDDRAVSYDETWDACLEDLCDQNLESTEILRKLENEQTKLEEELDELERGRNHKRSKTV